MGFEYKFPAIKGKQAKDDYYISMVPISLLSKLFPEDEDQMVQAEYRAQRKINESRIPEIKKYILTNRDNYVFSALSASIDGDISFESVDENVGFLKIDMNSKFLINDGQHRKAALLEAVKEDSSLSNETISIVFFADKGLSRSQQMFTDLNKNAVKTSNSLSTLYNSRDPLAIATREVIKQVPFFAKFIDKERDILGKNSSKLFTFYNLYKANSKIIRNGNIAEDDTTFLCNYWNVVCKNMPEWNEVYDRSMTKREIRENYISTLAITLLALGRVGRTYYEEDDKEFNELRKLSKIDWLRSNPDWLGRAIRNDGKVSNSEESSILICSYIKNSIGLKLNKEEEQKENILRCKNERL